MDNFLLNEALSEQSLGTNTTHLLLDDTHSKILAYISLCADTIPLELQERQNEGLHYFTAPALKIARLAVDSDFHRQGLGKKLIRFTTYSAHKISDICGIVFITLDCYEHRVPFYEHFYEHFGFMRNQLQSQKKPFDNPISMRARGCRQY